MSAGKAGLHVSVATFYHFTRFDDPHALRARLLAVLAPMGVRGTVILASEGVNGTLAGDDDAIAEALSALRALPDCGALSPRLSRARSEPFGRLKLKVKREIVTMGVADVDPVRHRGSYVAPDAWDALIADPEVLLIDTRNAFEVAVGTFAGAVDPGTARFSDFPVWWRGYVAGLPPERRPRTVAMFCTGGIRCEKASAFLRSEGVADVRHLQGGLLAYLEQPRSADSRWRGECFVFDERVAVGDALGPGAHRLCRACGLPLDPATGRPAGAAQCFRGASCLLSSPSSGISASSISTSISSSSSGSASPLSSSSSSKSSSSSSSSSSMPTGSRKVPR